MSNERVNDHGRSSQPQHETHPLAHPGKDHARSSDSRHKANHPEKPAPGLTYDVTPGDVRQSLETQATALAEADTFLFRNLNLPESEDLLAAIRKLSKDMGPSGESPEIGNFPNGAELSIEKEKGHITTATITYQDGSTDTAHFNKRFHVTSETIESPLANRTRHYRLNGTVKTEENSSLDEDGKPISQETLSFDSKGKNIIASHLETDTDVTDDKRMPNGSGLLIRHHEDSDPSKAFTLKVVTHKNGTAVEDQTFENGDTIHAEADAQGRILKAEELDKKTKTIHFRDLMPDGKYRESTGFGI